MDPYVIVGNGVAAINAIEAIRALDQTTPIRVFTDQECEFYSRPALYYVMLARIKFQDAWGRPADFYSRHGAGLRCGTIIAELRTQEHALVTSRGEQIRYSKLLLATGTRGRVLPWAEKPLKGIVTLNTLMDVMEITDLLSTAKTAVVAGGGLTSIELVEACRHYGVDTTFVMRGDRFLRSQLTPEEAEFVHARLRAAGVKLRLEDEIAAPQEQDGRIAGATLRSGEEIPCEVVGCTVGVVANKELAQMAGAETATGIVVDDQMRTTLPDIYAAGDVAQVRGPEGAPQPAEMLWYVAADMGRVAGANMAGGRRHYRPRVFLNVSEFCGIDFCGVGDIVPSQPNVEEIVVREPRGQGSIRLVLRDAALAGACFVGDLRLADLARALIAQGARPADLPAGHPIGSLFQ